MQEAAWSGGVAAEAKSRAANEESPRRRERARASSRSGGVEGTSGIGDLLAPLIQTSLGSVTSEAGMKKLANRAMRFHPLARVAGVSSTLSRGPSRACKRRNAPTARSHAHARS